MTGVKKKSAPNHFEVQKDFDQPSKHLIFSQVTQFRVQTSCADQNGERVYTLKPQLSSAIHGSKSFIDVADMILPMNYCFDEMAIDASINMAVVHQMILRYICSYFTLFTKDPEIGILSYDQLKLLLKNKYLNAPSEDCVVDALENWISNNEVFKVNALEYDQDRKSNDNGRCYNQLVDLSKNINWPILSLEMLVKILAKPSGTLKKFKFIQNTIFQEIMKRENAQFLKTEKDMQSTIRYS